MEQTEEKLIDQKYIDMVERFKAIPNDRKHTVERLKMILFKFEPWYWKHKDELTRDERHYLNDNIHRCESAEDIDKTPHPQKEWWVNAANIDDLELSPIADF
jgi:hypothetical protein